jgi:thiol-disulfide isomerase/thioredoxin
MGVVSYGQTPPSADLVLKQALKEAEKENKNVFIIFHASWCGWCRKMDSSINDKNCKSFFYHNYIIKHLTVYESADKKTLENPGALEMLTGYKGKDEGIPFWLIFDSKGNLLADSQLKPGVNSGCPATADEVDYFINVLRKTAKINGEEIRNIRERFLKN